MVGNAPGQEVKVGSMGRAAAGLPRRASRSPTAGRATTARSVVELDPPAGRPDGRLSRRRREFAGLCLFSVVSAFRRNRTTLPAYLALLAAVAGIAWSAILVRWAGVPGAASAFYRVLVAGAVLIPWRLVRGGDATGVAARGGGRGPRRRVLRARYRALEHVGDVHRRGGGVDPRQQHAGLRRPPVVARVPQASALVVLDRPVALARRLPDHHAGAGAGQLRAAHLALRQPARDRRQRVLRGLPGDDPARPAVDGHADVQHARDRRQHRDAVAGVPGAAAAAGRLCPAHVGGGRRASASSRSSPPTSRSSTRSATCPRHSRRWACSRRSRAPPSSRGCCSASRSRRVQIPGAGVVLAGIYVVNREAIGERTGSGIGIGRIAAPEDWL